jgi:hypothetical protein
VNNQTATGEYPTEVCRDSFHPGLDTHVTTEGGDFELYDWTLIIVRWNMVPGFREDPER